MNSGMGARAGREEGGMEANLPGGNFLLSPWPGAEYFLKMPTRKEHKE